MFTDACDEFYLKVLRLVQFGAMELSSGDGDNAAKAAG